MIMNHAEKLCRFSLTRVAIPFCALLMVAVLVGSGCATDPWKKRVGSLTFEEAVRELGPPEGSMKLKSGLTTYSWYIPSAWGALDKVILTFDESGNLVDGNQQYMGNVTPPMGPVFIDRRIYW
jgi:hypothetical protein